MIGDAHYILKLIVPHCLIIQPTMPRRSTNQQFISERTAIIREVLSANDAFSLVEDPEEFIKWIASTSKTYKNNINKLTSAIEANKPFDWKARIRTKTEEKKEKKEKVPLTKKDEAPVLDCRICFDSICDPVHLECGHIFCCDCISLHGTASGRTCPLCRAGFHKAYRMPQLACFLRQLDPAGYKKREKENADRKPPTSQTYYPYLERNHGELTREEEEDEVDSSDDDDDFINPSQNVQRPSPGDMRIKFRDNQ